ncbi:hypothetical protein [Arthrobacter sp. 2MCAF14]|uniref:hypothetical protein n=1 Tax=Arthrobacter sp. 2MCAF14 TaxID=3232982 RepID=UPI003F8DB784
MSNPAGPRIGLRAHFDAMNMEVPELIQALRDILGARLVAYLGSVKETRAVRQWADPEDPRKPSAAVEQRLRDAYQIAGTLREVDSATVIQAWFQGMNPYLEDHSPAMVLREGPPEESRIRVLAAARAFSSPSAA